MNIITLALHVSHLQIDPVFSSYNDVYFLYIHESVSFPIVKLLYMRQSIRKIKGFVEKFTLAPLKFSKHCVCVSLQVFLLNTINTIPQLLCVTLLILATISCATY